MSGHVNKSRAVTLSLLTVCDSRPTLFLKKRTSRGFYFSYDSYFLYFLVFAISLCRFRMIFGSFRGEGGVKR